MMSVSLVIALVVSVVASTEARKLPDYNILDPLPSDILSKPLDWFLFELIPRLIDQKPASKIPDKSVYKTYLLTDVSNDDAAHLSTVSSTNKSTNRSD